MLSDSSPPPRSRTYQVDGHPPSITGLHSALVGAATAHLSDIHRAKCTVATPLLFARMDCHGVGEDLNQAVRMFAVAVSQRRQVIFLPPSPEERHNPANCGLPQSIEPSAEQPWHWLVGQQIPLSSILQPSACHVELLQRMPKIMHAISQSSSRNLSQTLVKMGAHALAEVSRESASLWRSHLSVSRHVPRLFQRQGLLWWFQVLTTYLVRIREPLSTLLAGHPAMKPFLVPEMPRRDTLDDVRWLGWGVRCAKRFCDGVGPSWLPTARFDVGAHIRLGDSCRQKGLSKHYYTHVRRCDLNLSVVLRKMREAGVSNGTLFVASDSQRIIDEVSRGAALPFKASFLALNRSRFDTSKPTESIGTTASRLNSLLEALMDMLLLSRADHIAGQMMSNFPRVAIQMRVQAPRRRAPGYISLDERPWCSRTSCRDAWLSPAEHMAATRRELQRNPIIKA